MEYGFYPQPPVANMFHLVSDAVAFHGVEDHNAMHAALNQEKAGGGAYDTRCTPVFLDETILCMRSTLPEVIFVFTRAGG